MTLRKWILLSVLFSMLVGCDNRWSSGDRVLVSKCSYDTGLGSPGRYNVVVFKYPSGPMERNTPKNYIKRLLGLPGELIAIFFGRLYHWSPQEGEAPPFDDLKEEGVKATDLWKRDYMHIDSPKTKQWFDEGKFKILRKPPHVMLALRRIVYDNDYQAKDLKGKLDRWNPEAKSGWKADKETGFTHDGKAEGEVDWLRYQHLLRPEGVNGGALKVKRQLITDSMDYNNFNFERIGRQHHWVGDLMLECNVDVTEPKGEFWIELSKGINRFQARWDLASGQCTLFRLGQDGKREELDSRPTRLKGPGSYMVRLANIDARLTVWVDRDLPFGDGKEYDPPEIRKGSSEKDVAVEDRRGATVNDLEPASIGSKGASVKLAHLRLWRDTYYITRVGQGRFDSTDYDDGVGVPDDAWSDATRWEPIRKQRFTTMYVQPGHYLCLGDNSQASSDSRDWGVVPDRLMLGRALMVYFPLDRIGPIR